jgi:C4-dicarboxylate-specific signal transduction histidine kinase
VLDVIDNGAGMLPDVLRMADEPFFTTKEDAPMSGMGLPAVAGFATQSGGCMVMSSVSRRGTSIGLSLPTASRDVEAGATTVAVLVRRSVLSD